MFPSDYLGHFIIAKVNLLSWQCTIPANVRKEKLKIVRSFFYHWIMLYSSLSYSNLAELCFFDLSLWRVATVFKLRRLLMISCKDEFRTSNSFEIIRDPAKSQLPLCRASKTVFFFRPSSKQFLKYKRFKLLVSLQSFPAKLFFAMQAKPGEISALSSFKFFLIKIFSLSTM